MNVDQESHDPDHEVYLPPVSTLCVKTSVHERAKDTDRRVWEPFPP